MNTIREGYPAEVAALLPVLHATYRSIGRYQRERSSRHQEEVLAELAAASDALRFFQPHVPRPKRPYFTAAADEALPLSDRIIALDVAVGAMHIEFSMERAYMHRESEALRRALELSRVVEGEEKPLPMALRTFRFPVANTHPHDHSPPPPAAAPSGP